MEKTKKNKKILSLMGTRYLAFFMYSIENEVKWLMKNESRTQNKAVLIVKGSRLKELKEKQEEFASSSGYKKFQLKIQINQIKDEIRFIEAFLED